MMTDALGMLEVEGYVAAIEFSDVMAKVADVAILGLKKTKGMGWMTIFIEGDVAAVQAAVQAAKNQALAEESFVAAKVIPRPAAGVREFITDLPTSEENAVGEKDTPEKESPMDQAVDREKPAPEKSAESGSPSGDLPAEEKKPVPRKRSRRSKPKTDDGSDSQQGDDQT